MPRRKASRNLTPKDWKNIKILTKKAVGIAGILEDDCPDIEQELAIALWRESRKFSKRQSSWSTYSCIVLKKYLQKIIRTRKQPKSHYSCNANMSLNILITDQEYPEWAFEVIDLVNTDGLLEDWTSSPEHKGISLKIDMDKFISNMLVHRHELVDWFYA
jgi:DNA-directed RNA polymerase specialized sigma24 family protein